MFHVQCRACGTSAYVDCTCPPGHDPVIAGHLPAVAVGNTTVAACPMTDLGATVICPPGSGCCDGSSHPGLSHDLAAHLGHPNMVAWLAAASPAVTAAGEPDHEPDHDGEHAAGNPDCAVCRPVTITVMPGSAQLTPVNGG